MIQHRAAEPEPQQPIDLHDECAVGQCRKSQRLGVALLVVDYEELATRTVFHLNRTLLLSRLPLELYWTRALASG